MKTAWQRKIVNVAKACGWTIADLNEFLVAEFGRPIDQMTDNRACWIAWKDLCHLRDFKEWRRHRIVVEKEDPKNEADRSTK